jgi:MarR family transcriptional regulator, lower aerobic nicotinate degradation pathway regulator
VADNQEPVPHDTVGAWAKRCYLAGRLAMEDELRPHGLGATQWYVLYQLAGVGPTRQRDLQRILQIERATVSVVVSSLVRKALVEQVPDVVDQRQRLLRLTSAGSELWASLPDLTRIHAIAFDGIDGSEIDTAIRVLRTATERLEDRSRLRRME